MYIYKYDYIYYTYMMIIAYLHCIIANILIIADLTLLSMAVDIT